MKATLVTIFLFGFSLLGFSGHSGLKKSLSQKNQAADSGETKVIESVLRQYETALNNSDVGGVLRLYADDGVFMPSDAPTAVGSEAVRKAYEHVFATIKLDIGFTIDEIVERGDFAFARTVSRGRVTVLANGTTAPEENRELFVLSKNGGSWKIARYMFNKMSPR